MLAAPIMTPVADLRPGGEAFPIEIRVVREWFSLGLRGDCCYVFVDKDGTGIQATGSSTEQAYFKSVLKLGSCYRVGNYICEPAKTYMRAVPHGTGIRIGKAATFDEISGDELPHYCFNFVAYNDLCHRIGKTDMLTYYIGKYEDIAELFQRQKIDIAKLILQDLSGPTIETTFWRDMALALTCLIIALILLHMMTFIIGLARPTCWQNLQIKGMAFLFESNEACVKQYVNSLKNKTIMEKKS